MTAAPDPRGVHVLAVEAAAVELREAAARQMGATVRRDAAVRAAVTAGVTQQTVAAAAGVTQSRVSQIIGGGRDD